MARTEETAPIATSAVVEVASESNAFLTSRSYCGDRANLAISPQPSPPFYGIPRAF